MNNTAAAGAQPAPFPAIDNVTYVPDRDHYWPGRNGHRIRLILLHDTEGTNSGPWLSQVAPGGESVHHLYGRDGRRYDIVQRVDTAYHAGVSAWGPWRGAEVVGHEANGTAVEIGVLNLIGIGHEFESTASVAGPGNGYTAAQIASAAYTVATELVSYGLDWRAVACHRDVALPSGRRHDPSAFDLVAFKQQVAAWVTFLRSVPPSELADYCR
jgi:N-acetyl-anhydromuramyl-L-alanine amidase AmpD